MEIEFVLKVSYKLRSTIKFRFSFGRKHPPHHTYILILALIYIHIQAYFSHRLSFQYFDLSNTADRGLLSHRTDSRMLIKYSKSLYGM